MAKMEQAHCGHCDKPVLAVCENQVNHILHLLISCLLCGFWLPVWLVLAAMSHRYRCPHCGSPVAQKRSMGSYIVSAVVIFFLLLFGSCVVISQLAADRAQKELDKQQTAPKLEERSDTEAVSPVAPTNSRRRRRQ